MSTQWVWLKNDLSSHSKHVSFQTSLFTVAWHQGPHDGDTDSDGRSQSALERGLSSLEMVVTIFSDVLQTGKRCFILPSGDRFFSTLDHTSMSWSQFVLKVSLFYSAYKGQSISWQTESIFTLLKCRDIYPNAQLTPPVTPGTCSSRKNAPSHFLLLVAPD